MAERAAEEPAARCVHHWKLDPPSGNVIHGVCRGCGAERDYFDDAPPKAEFNRLSRGRGTSSS